MAGHRASCQETERQMLLIRSRNPAHGVTLCSLRVGPLHRRTQRHVSWATLDPVKLAAKSEQGDCVGQCPVGGNSGEMMGTDGSRAGESLQLSPLSAHLEERGRANSGPESTYPLPIRSWQSL